MYRMTTGAEEISDAAISCPYRGRAPPSVLAAKMFSWTATVCVAGSVRTLANRMSFQPTKSEKTNVMIMPGIASGKMILRSVDPPVGRPWRSVSPPVQALVRSADHAPNAITAEVTALANALSTPRLDRGVALRRFADEIDDSLGDMITLSLEIAVSAQASQRVPDVLRTMAAGVAEEVKARRAVEADRAGPRNEARMIVIVQVLFVLGVATLTSYTKIYGTFTGQMVLAVLGAAVVLALWLLRKYSSAEAPPRLLGAAGGRR